MSTKRMEQVLRGVVGLTAGAAALLAASAGAGAGSGETVIGTGPDFVYGASAVDGATFTISARDVGAEGTQLRLAVEGVDAPAGTTFGAHVHVNPCGATGGAAGGHYVHADADGSALQQREVWLDFTVDAHGDGRSVATRNWTIANRAGRSVTVHAVHTDHETGAAGARLACIDLDA